MSMTARGSDLEIGVPAPLFALKAAGSNAIVPNQYDVAPDGQRFLVVRGGGSGQPDPVVVSLNWAAKLPKPMTLAAGVRLDPLEIRSLLGGGVQGAMTLSAGTRVTAGRSL